jgi:hypothetical protein
VRCRSGLGLESDLSLNNVRQRRQDALVAEENAPDLVHFTFEPGDRLMVLPDMDDERRLTLQEHRPGRFQAVISVPRLVVIAARSRATAAPASHSDVGRHESGCQVSLMHMRRRLVRTLLACVLLLPSWSVLGRQGGGGGGRVGPGGVTEGVTTTAPTPEPPRGTGAISGVVIDGLTNAPVPEAVVYLGVDGRGTATAQSRQLTDGKGRFVFLEVAPGDLLTISATKPGYLQGGFNLDNKPGSSGSRLRLREGEWVPDVRITLWRPGVISGIVSDERGEPVVGVDVRVVAQLSIGGGQRLASGPLGRTDDRGAYRISDLPPGRYVVQVPSVQSSLPANWSPPAGARGTPTPEPMLELDQAKLLLRNFPTPPPPAPGRTFGYPPIFAPSVTSIASAQVVDLNFGEERGNVDVTLQPAAVWRVSGRVDGPPEALKGLTLRLLPQELEGLGYGSEAATALVGSDGRFAFANVPAGSYIVDAPPTINEIKMSPRSSMTLIPLRPPLPFIIFVTM